jgi:hypothetical protein
MFRQDRSVITAAAIGTQGAVAVQHDDMDSATIKLSRALAEAGFDPR